MFNVLVFPGGTEIGLEIWQALHQCKDIRLYSAGSNVSNHAPFVFARHSVLSDVHDQSWVGELNQIVAEQEIDYVFPAHDDVTIALVQNAHKIQARIVSSPLETCMITRSKSLTYKCLSDVVRVPMLFEKPEQVEQYPIFVKPDRGQGSQRTYIVHKPDYLDWLVRQSDDYIISEYLPGEEYTIDCLSDREMGLLFCGGRQRVRTRSGISMHSRIVYDNAFGDYARAISSKLKFFGAWFFQLKKDQGNNYKLLEVAPRIAGTMSLYRVQGINFPLLSVYEQERVPIEVRPNKIDVEIDRALTNRYRHDLKYDTVYVDLDDTLIMNGAVNVSIVRFLFQCINLGIRVILLTKHVYDLDRTLSQHRLSGIFDEIVRIPQSASKADYIRGPSAILIDDSYSERRTVSEKCGIPTFDCSMIEMLLDDRV